MIASIKTWHCYECFVSPVPTSPSAIIKNTIKNELRVISPLIRKSFDVEKSTEALGHKICLLETEISNLARRTAPPISHDSDELITSIESLQKELSKFSASPITHLVTLR
jgi:hypothetical protein